MKWSVRLARDGEHLGEVDAETYEEALALGIRIAARTKNEAQRLLVTPIERVEVLEERDAASSVILEYLSRTPAPSVRGCRRCGRSMAVTKSGHLRAHHCPHGKWCVRPYSARREGAKAEACEPCAVGRQLTLYK